MLGLEWDFFFALVRDEIILTPECFTVRKSKPNKLFDLKNIRPESRWE